ncbi:uncharacterized protein J3D65DRAFT_207631 [Phyllosticta citribraziliensis]|uniref:Secreted protein n=1 Tax=Phyllosticta citribraziliensis TaxID=989973 RepID=A0ABR1M3U2_9PEZI
MLGGSDGYKRSFRVFCLPACLPACLPGGFVTRLLSLAILAPWPSSHPVLSHLLVSERRTGSEQANIMTWRRFRRLHIFVVVTPQRERDSIQLASPPSHPKPPSSQSVHCLCPRTQERTHSRRSPQHDTTQHTRRTEFTDRASPPSLTRHGHQSLLCWPSRNKTKFLACQQTHRCLRTASVC